MFCQRRRVFSFVLYGDSNCQKITELEDKNVVDKRAKKKVQVKIRNKKAAEMDSRRLNSIYPFSHFEHVLFKKGPLYCELSRQEIAEVKIRQPSSPTISLTLYIGYFGI